MSAVGTGSLRRWLCDDHQLWDPVSVLLHMLSLLPGGEAVPVIWVDTGYLPPETYRYAQTLSERLGTRLVVAQSSVSPARMEALHGRLWETGREEDMDLYLRLRKVDPLEEALDKARCAAGPVVSVAAKPMQHDGRVGSD